MLKIPRPWLMLTKKSLNTRERMAMSFMTMLSAGPEVSFSGSPTVSPVTAFLWAELPLPQPDPRPPDSMYFLALSQAPPELDIEMASCTPETKAPDKRPAVQFLPKKIPARSGERMTR